MLTCCNTTERKSNKASTSGWGAPAKKGERGRNWSGRRIILSLRKVVPTLTSKSAEIYLSMAGAKQLATLSLSWFRPEPYVQQWCARGTILRCTVVLAEGATSEAGEEAGPPGPRGTDWGKCQYCGEGKKCVVNALCPPPAARGLPLLL
jgi:hypothetical protein